MISKPEGLILTVPEAEIAIASYGERQPDELQATIINAYEWWGLNYCLQRGINLAADSTPAQSAHQASLAFRQQLVSPSALLRCSAIEQPIRLKIDAHRHRITAATLLGLGLHQSGTMADKETKRFIADNDLVTLAHTLPNTLATIDELSNVDPLPLPDQYQTYLRLMLGTLKTILEVSWSS